MDYSSIFTERTTGTYWMKQLDTETFTIKDEWVHPVRSSHNNMIFLDDSMFDINEHTRSDFYWFIDDKFYVARQLTIAELRDKIGQSTPISKSSGNVIDEKIKIVKVEDISISSIIQSKLVIWGRDISLDDSKKLGVGPQTLIGGNMEAGFFGEVQPSGLISGTALAAKIGLTAGTAQFDDQPWLKFAYKGKIEYVAKRPLRHSVSWYDINAADAVYGDRIIEIAGKKYKIRLLRGFGEDKQPNPKSVGGKYDGDTCWNSEWNRLMLPIHVDAPSNWKYKHNVSSPTEDWGVDYTDIDLGCSSVNGSGIKSWCQDTAEKIRYAIYRGNYTVSHSSSSNIIFNSNGYCWRPVLELIN